MKLARDASVTDAVSRTQLAKASLPRVYATLADVCLPDDVCREAVTALLSSCSVADVLMHLRDACRSEASRYPEVDQAHEHFERSASAVQRKRETVDSYVISADYATASAIFFKPDA